MLKGIAEVRVREVVSIFLVTCTLFVMAACNVPGGSDGTSGAPITIGLSVSKTGDFSQDGAALLQGYQIWADYVNSHGGFFDHRPVQLDVFNDNSSNDQAIADYQKMITVNHDDLILGPYSSTLTLSVASVAEKYHYPLVEGAGEAPKIFQADYSNLFAVSLPATDYLKSFVYYVLSLPQAERPKSIAYVTSDDFFTQPQVDGARQLLEKGGVSTAYYTVYPAASTDYATIAEPAMASNPDVVVLGTTGQSDAVGITNAFIKAHFNPKLLIETAGPDQGSQFSGPIGGVSRAEGIFVPNNGWFPNLNTYQNSDFISAYIAKYGGTAEGISADSVEAFSSGQVLQQAVIKANSLDNAKLIQEMHSGDTFNSVQGAVQFTGNGQNDVAEPFLFQWQDGALIPVYPANQAQANPEYPKKIW